MRANLSVRKVTIKRCRVDMTENQVSHDEHKLLFCECTRSNVVHFSQSILVSVVEERESYDQTGNRYKNGLVWPLRSSQDQFRNLKQECGWRQTRR